ncbi:MAG TPA: diaminopimelate decarboxylase [Candidatus Acidoferrum sp.]|nr:diaminopimelate decarboxylase [Candidatus Acidoferrum sp.]
MFLTKELAFKLAEEYGTPLYVYSEDILRQRATELATLLPNRHYKASYSVKANNNIALLKIIRECGLGADAMSPGEILTHMEAGYKPGEIFYIANNVSPEEMKFAVDKGCRVSVDSISQLKLYCKLAPGGKVSLRLNTGIGLGHSDKVVTAGKKTKFGIALEDIDEAKAIAAAAGVKIFGINHHLGSLFLEPTKYLEGAKNLLAAAMLFEELEFVDFGGGYGMPYAPGEERLDIPAMRERFDAVVAEFLKVYPNKDIEFKAEPGRYIVAECGELLGDVHAVKCNYGVNYIGTDLGFNVLIRPAMYDSYHEMRVLSKDDEKETYTATVVGNICESGDVLGKDRLLTKAKEGDLVSVDNAGAYAYAMASNYNVRQRPAEVLICKDGSVKLIRRRDTFEELIANQKWLY